MAFMFGSGGGKLIEGPTHAINAFGLNGSVYFNNHPIHKFMFAVKININPASGISVSEDDLILIVKNVQIGGISIDTDEMNEYNRSRLVYNKLRFSDTVITMHDVADGKTMRFWKEYYEYYFADGRSSPGFGYDTTLIPGSNRRYAIDSIEIFEMQAGKATKTVLERPKIVNFAHDNADYETFQGLMQMTFTIKPEYIRYEPSSSIPGNIQRQLEQGGTPEALSSMVSQVIATQGNTITRDLTNSLNEEFLNNVSASAERRVINELNNAEVNESVANSLVQGSPETRASTSALDSLGRLSADPQRTLPIAQNQNQPSSILPLNPSPVIVDNSAIGNVIDGDEQGGND